MLLMTFNQGWNNSTAGEALALQVAEQGSFPHMIPAACQEWSQNIKSELSP